MIDPKDFQGLDAESSEDLRKFAQLTRIAARTVSNKMFPIMTRDTRESAVQLLGSYAAMKADAQDARIAGEIERALSLEAECETLYARLPSWARW